jgi:hypothetical protein
MNASIPSCRMGVLFYLATLAAAYGQVELSSQPTQQAAPSSATLEVSQAQATLQAFQQEQQVLAQSFSAMLTLNPTPQQMEAWQQQNAAALANQQQLALDMADESALEPMPVMTQPNIPADASPTLQAFLTTQAALVNAGAQIHNQLLNALPLDVSEEQISQMQQSEDQLFQQQQGATIQLQAQQAQALANESARQPLPVPPPLVIAPGSTSQLAAFLTLRDQLMRAQIQLQNQYVTADPSVRDAALQQWRQQNDALFQQLQQLAQNLSATTSTPQN